MWEDIKFLEKQGKILNTCSQLRKAYYISLSYCENLHASYWITSKKTIIQRHRNN